MSAYAEYKTLISNCLRTNVSREKSALLGLQTIEKEPLGYKDGFPHGTFKSIQPRHPSLPHSNRIVIRGPFATVHTIERLSNLTKLTVLFLHTSIAVVGGYERHMAFARRTAVGIGSDSGGGELKQIGPANKEQTLVD